VRNYARLLVVVSCALGSLTRLCAEERAGEETYGIKLKRPMPEKCQVAATLVRKNNSITVRGGIREEPTGENHSIDLEATITKIPTGDDPQRISIAITKFVQRSEHENKTLIEPGVVVIGEIAKDAPRFYLQNKMLDRRLAYELGNMFPYDHKDSDEIYGTAARKRKGETWELNKKLIVDILNKGEFKVTEDVIVGETILLDIRKEDGVDCLEVRTRVDWKDYKSTVEGREIDVKKRLLEVQTLLPVDVSLPKVKTTRHTIDEHTLRVLNDDLVYEVSRDETTQVTIKILKPDDAAEVFTKLEPPLELFAQLASDNWREREEASAKLTQLGPEALPHLRVALRQCGDAEARKRLVLAAARLEPMPVEGKFYIVSNQTLRNGERAGLSNENATGTIEIAKGKVTFYQEYPGGNARQVYSYAGEVPTTVSGEFEIPLKWESIQTDNAYSPDSQKPRLVYGGTAEGPRVTLRFFDTSGVEGIVTCAPVEEAPKP
jgi:hypothetical protein